MWKTKPELSYLYFWAHNNVLHRDKASSRLRSDKKSQVSPISLVTSTHPLFKMKFPNNGCGGKLASFTLWIR